jgi:hypothetical protein
MSQGKSRSFAAVRRFDMQAHRRRVTPVFMPFVAAVLLSGTSLLAESDSVELGGIQEIVVRDATDHVSDEVGAVQIYRNGDPLGAAFVAESNDTGDESRTVVYSVGKAAGYSRDLRLVGFHGHVTNAAGSGYGVLGSFGGYVDVDDTGINDAQAWGALGGEVGANTYAVISNGDQYSTTGALWTLADSSLQQEVESIDGALGIVAVVVPAPDVEEVAERVLAAEVAPLLVSRVTGPRAMICDRSSPSTSSMTRAFVSPLSSSP